MCVIGAIQIAFGVWLFGCCWFGGAWCLVLVVDGGWLVSGTQARHRDKRR
jgi:hypothetical protein